MELTTQPTTSGQCRHCLAGHYSVYSVREHPGFHIRYLRCGRCGFRPGKEVVPIQLVQRRNRLKQQIT